MVWPGERTHINKQTNIQTYKQNRSFQNWALYYSIVGPVKIGICISNYPSRTVETTFLDTILKLVYFLVVNNKYLPHVVDNIIFGISVPSRTVESNSLRSFWNFCIFCLLYTHINNNKFTYDKFKSAKFGFSIVDIV